MPTTTDGGAPGRPATRRVHIARAHLARGLRKQAVRLRQRVARRGDVALEKAEIVRPAPGRAYPGALSVTLRAHRAAVAHITEGVEA